MFIHLHMCGAVSRLNLPKEIAYIVADRRSLDLDHVCAKIAKEGTKIVPGEEHRRLDHTHTFEQLDHGEILTDD